MMVICILNHDRFHADSRMLRACDWQLHMLQTQVCCLIQHTANTRSRTLVAMAQPDDVSKFLKTLEIGRVPSVRYAFLR